MSTSEMNSVALLVVDMQDGFLRAIPNAEKLLNRCCFAVEAANALGIRAIFTTQVPEKLGDVNERLKGLVDDPEIFPKTAFSALRAPGLTETLEKQGVDHIILAGIETSICVYQTALAATNAELYVTVFSDCTGARRADDHAAILRALAGIGCHVLPSEAVFYSILEDAKHAAFKPYTQLVKKYHTAVTP